MAVALDQHASGLSPEVMRTVVDMLNFRTANVTDPADVRAVVGDAHEPTLVYLALPTGLLKRALLPCIVAYSRPHRQGLGQQRGTDADLSCRRRATRGQYLIASAIRCGDPAHSADQHPGNGE